jgi:ABC-2 type transport system permease protein
MTPFLRQAAVVARRDFIAMVATPTFLLFLLAPLFMVLIGIAGGSGATQVAESTAKASRIAAIASAPDGMALDAADKRLRAVSGASSLTIVPSHGDDRKVAEALFEAKDKDYFAVMFGPLERPVILHEAQSKGSAMYLAELAEQAVRARKAGVAGDASLVTPTLEPVAANRAGVGGRKATGYFAVFGIFFLTLLLAGQAIGMLAEEKSNKVIEILAAAAPLEAVFLGKLVGMFGVALLFVTFWGSILGTGLAIAPQAAGIGAFDPAVGPVAFVLLCVVYFTMSYMLLGAVFLGIGGLAGTMREIQMMSLPITIFQVGMFGLASAAASQPGSRLALAAEWFPFSSPYAMAARAATDGALWPHLLAMVWQAIWVGLTIWLAARLFRIGVLKSGRGWKDLFRRSPA